MNWTRSRPTEAGPYWLRWRGLFKDGHWRTEMVEVRDYPGELVVFEATRITARALGIYEGWWMGPLPVPDPPREGE